MLVEFGRSSCLLHIRQMLSTQCIIVRIRWLLQLLRQWAIRSDHSASEWYIALRQHSHQQKERWRPCWLTFSLQQPSAFYSTYKVSYCRPCI